MAELLDHDRANRRVECHALFREIVKAEAK
jgi:hypothetical protein